MDYTVLEDGWIKVDAVDFPLIGMTGGNRRLLIGLNQLFVRIGGKNVLIDTGLGDKWKLSQISLQGFYYPRRMIGQLADFGVQPDDVDVVIFTHLHYDHSGGGTYRKEDSILAPTFTNALYYVQERELNFARNPDPDRRDDYKFEDFDPLDISGQLVKIDGDAEILPGLTVHLASGHSPGHQVVLIRDSSANLFFPGDLFSVQDHANLTVTTEYDYDPVLLLSERRKWLTKAVNNKWQCVFCHAVNNPIGIIEFVE